jgi:hypothetical protein
MIILTEKQKEMLLEEFFSSYEFEQAFQKWYETWVEKNPDILKEMKDNG